MNFTSAQVVEEVVWNMKLADMGRSSNRAKINAVFNGNPPYSDEEAADAKIGTNVNFLEGAKIAHDCSRQYENAFKTTANFFTVAVDRGPVHKRALWSSIITSKLNRILKNSLEFSELQDAVFANLILHGPGPSAWMHDQRWMADELTVGDLLVPSRTLRSFRNLEYFAIFKKFTPWKLWQMTHGAGAQMDRGWNVDLADKCMAWAHKQRGQTRSSGEYLYSPEKWQEDIKSDAGLYMSDIAATVDCWDFYFFDDDGEESGWNRRIILDTPSLSEAGNAETNKAVQTAKTFVETRGEYLYSSGHRKFASKLSQILHCQFGDASRVSPFRYHSVRSLGFLLYSVCHLQNRLRCRINEACFESLMQFFRVSNPEDAERLQKIDLRDKGIIPDGLNFVPTAERWKYDMQLADTVMQLNRQSMVDNSLSYTQDYNFDTTQDRKTATQFMGEQSATNAMVSSMLNRAYGYEKFRYLEICRRFCIANSADPDVREFRAAALKEGVPEDVLDVACWEITPEKVMGGGNAQLALQQAQMLMSQIVRYDPEPQRDILRQFTLAVTHDAGMTMRFVPENVGKITDSVHDAQLAFPALMMGSVVSPRTGINHIEYVEALLICMEGVIKKIEGTQNSMATKDQVIGLKTAAQHVQQHIDLIAQDPEEKGRVKQYTDTLGQLMKYVAAYEQRNAEADKAAAEAQAQANNQEGQAKAQAVIQDAALKAKLAQEAHAQEMAQAAETHRNRMAMEMESERRKAEKHALDMRIATEKAANELTLKRHEVTEGIDLDKQETEAKIANQKKQAEAAAKAKAEKPEPKEE